MIAWPALSPTTTRRVQCALFAVMCACVQATARNPPGDPEWQQPCAARIIGPRLLLADGFRGSSAARPLAGAVNRSTSSMLGSERSRIEHQTSSSSMKDENAGAAALVWDGHCLAPAVAAVALNAPTCNSDLTVTDKVVCSAWLANLRSTFGPLSVCCRRLRRYSPKNATGPAQAARGPHHKLNPQQGHAMVGARWARQQRITVLRHHNSPGLHFTTEWRPVINHLRTADNPDVEHSTTACEFTTG